MEEGRDEGGQAIGRVTGSDAFHAPSLSLPPSFVASSIPRSLSLSIFPIRHSLYRSPSLLRPHTGNTWPCVLHGCLAATEYTHTRALLVVSALRVADVIVCAHVLHWLRYNWRAACSLRTIGRRNRSRLLPPKNVVPSNESEKRSIRDNDRVIVWETERSDGYTPSAVPPIVL